LSHVERERAAYDRDATGQRVDGFEASNTRFLEQVTDVARMLLDQSHRVVGEPRRGSCGRDLEPIVGELPLALGDAECAVPHSGRRPDVPP
jgi:hypothetical protein